MLKQLRATDDHPRNHKHLPTEWIAPVRLLSRVKMQSYGSLSIEATHVHGRSDIEQIALTLHFIVMLHAVIAESYKQAKRRFINVISFVGGILQLVDNLRPTSWMDQSLALFRDVLKFSRSDVLHRSRVCKSQNLIFPSKIHTSLRP